MSKVVTVIGLGAGGTILSVGGAYMFGAFDYDANIDIPVSLATLKAEGGKKIINGYFDGLVLSEDNSTEWTATSGTPDTSFLTSSKGQVKARLVVNWEKFACSESQTDKSKWTGRIRWLWSALNGEGDKGFMLYVSAKPSDKEDAKMNVEGAIYILAKEAASTESGSTTQWKVKNHKITSANPTTISALPNNLPDVSKAINAKDNWGFAENGELSKFCKQETPPATDETLKNKFKGSWIFIADESKSDGKMINWSKGEQAWINALFGDVSSNFKDLVKDVSGKWMPEYFVNRPLGVTSESSK